MSASNATELAAWADVPPQLAALTIRGAEGHGLDLDEVRSDCRRRNLVKCRWWIVAHARHQGYSFPQIGRALNRDHSTIVHAVARMAA